MRKAIVSACCIQSQRGPLTRLVQRRQVTTTTRDRKRREIMPRSTHPHVQEKHDRGLLREQRSRFIRRRWRRNKRLYRIDEGTGAMVVNMNSRVVLRKIPPEALQELAKALGQTGPLLFLHPESLRHAPKELRRAVERGLGLHVLAANEMTRADSARDKHLNGVLTARHQRDRAKILTQRSLAKRSWKGEAETAER
jgi:uncharacterized FlaG/YvyC family protein